jgi:2-amino-4-hydroxy-6-hydroxymethyldihydropteridine diphosphokinase
LAKRVRAYVGLGANVGDERKSLSNAIRALAALPGVQLREVSPVYLTAPVGMTEQPDFLNAVVALDVPAGPEPETGALAFLAALKKLEFALGRRPAKRWGPRVIDLDLLIFGRHMVDVEGGEGNWLQVPHREAANRLFVLAPLSDIAPGLRPPGWGETVASVRRRQEQVEGQDAVRLVGPL